MRTILCSLTVWLALPIAPALAQEGGPIPVEPEAPPAASAAGWPLAYIERPLTLAAGMFEVQGALALDLSEDNVLDQVTIMPGVYYGVTDRLTLGVITNRYPFLGLLHGFCVGDDCGTVFRGLSLDGLYAFFDRSGLRVAAHGGVDISIVDTYDPVEGDFDTELRFALRAGAKLRYVSGRFALESDASIAIGSDVLFVVPIIPEFQLTPQLMLAAPVTFRASDDDAAIGLGLQVLYSIGPELDVWALFSFPDLESAEVRTLTFGIAYRTGT